jgi:hypothetical protein
MSRKFCLERTIRLPYATQRTTEPEDAAKNKFKVGKKSWKRIGETEPGAATEKIENRKKIDFRKKFEIRKNLEIRKI